MTKIGSFFWRILAACVAYAYHIDTCHAYKATITLPGNNYNTGLLDRLNTSVTVTWGDNANASDATLETDPNQYYTDGIITYQCAPSVAEGTTLSDCQGTDNTDALGDYKTAMNRLRSYKEIVTATGWDEATMLATTDDETVKSMLSSINSGLWSPICGGKRKIETIITVSECQAAGHTWLRGLKGRLGGCYETIGGLFAGITTGSREYRIGDINDDYMASALYDGWYAICESECENVPGTTVKADKISQKINPSYTNGTIVLKLCSDTYPWGTKTHNSTYSLMKCKFIPSVARGAKANAQYLHLYSAAEACQMKAGTTGVDDTGAFIFTDFCDPLNPY